MNNEKDKDQEKNTSRCGNLNPMFGKKHSYETKQKMSQSQKKRYSTMRQIVDEERIKQLTESPNIHTLIKRVVNDTLASYFEKIDTLGNK